MENKKENLSVNMEYSEEQTIPLALHEMHMARADRRLWRLCICWAVSVILIVWAFVWLWNQYDYESSTELSGVYNLVDSQGNVVSTDLEPDDVLRVKRFYFCDSYALLCVILLYSAFFSDSAIFYRITQSYSEWLTNKLLTKYQPSTARISSSISV